MDTSGYGGGMLKKKAKVYTNDPRRPVVTLTVSGEVERFARIDPSRVILRGVAGSTIKRSVKIIPDAKYPFKILEAKAKNGGNIRFELSELQEKDRKGYILNIENAMPKKGRYFDYIALKTDSKIKPTIQIGIYGFIVDGRAKP